jgi:hypothetical protein
MASENQRFYSVNQELIEENELLAIDHQHVQAVHEQLDLAMARLDRHTDQLEMVDQRRIDYGSIVRSLHGGFRLPHNVGDIRAVHAQQLPK